MAGKKPSTGRTNGKTPTPKTRESTRAKTKSGNGKNGDFELTHERIAERAYSIWQSRGCLTGQDHLYWQEAEEQLRLELRKQH